MPYYTTSDFKEMVQLEKNTNYNKELKLPLIAISNGTEYEEYYKKAFYTYENIRLYDKKQGTYFDRKIFGPCNTELRAEYYRILEKFEEEINKEKIRSATINSKLYSIFARNPKNIENLKKIEDLKKCEITFEMEYSNDFGEIPEGKKKPILDFTVEEFIFCGKLLIKNDYTLNTIGYHTLKNYISLYYNIKEKVEPLIFDENNISGNGEAFLSRHYDPLKDIFITYCVDKEIKIFILDGKFAIKEPNKELKKDLSDKEAEQLFSNIFGYAGITCGNNEKADIGPFNLMSFCSTYQPNIRKMFYKDEVTGKYMYNSYFDHKMNAKAYTIEDANCDIIDDFFNHICVGEKEANHVKNQLKVSIKTGIAPKDIIVFVVDHYSYGIDIFYNNILAPLHNNQSLKLQANELLHKLSDKNNGKGLVYISQVPTPFDKLDEQMLEYNLADICFNKESICSVFIVTSETSYLNIGSFPESFSVIKANFDFKSSNYLQTRSIQAMIQQIKEKLPIFFKKCMNEDIVEYSTLDNEIKTNIFTLGNRVSQHLTAYKMENIEFFKPLYTNTNPDYNKLYEDLNVSFNNKVPYVSQQNITKVYNAMENTDESEKAVIEKFKAMDKIFFHDDNFTRQPNSDKRYKIRSEYNDLYKQEK